MSGASGATEASSERQGVQRRAAFQTLSFLAANFWASFSHLNDHVTPSDTAPPTPSRNVLNI